MAINLNRKGAKVYKVARRAAVRAKESARLAWQATEESASKPRRASPAKRGG